MTLEYTTVRNLIWADELHTRITCEVNFTHLPEEFVNFTASPDDTETYSQEIFSRALAGEFGEIQEYVPIFSQEQLTEAKWEALRQERDRLLYEDTLIEKLGDESPKGTTFMYNKESFNFIQNFYEAIVDNAPSSDTTPLNTLQDISQQVFSQQVISQQEYSQQNVPGSPENPASRSPQSLSSMDTVSNIRNSGTPTKKNPEDEEDISTILSPIDDEVNNINDMDEKEYINYLEENGLDTDTNYTITKDSIQNKLIANLLNEEDESVIVKKIVEFENIEQSLQGNELPEVNSSTILTGFSSLKQSVKSFFASIFSSSQSNNNDNVEMTIEK
jgi:hypothetical protein